MIENNDIKWTNIDMEDGVENSQKMMSIIVASNA